MNMPVRATLLARRYRALAALAAVAASSVGEARAQNPPAAREETVLATLNRMAEGVNAGNAAAYARAYAPHAVIVIHGGGRLEGRAAIERYEVELLESYPGTRFGLLAVWHDGPEAVVHYGVNSPSPRGTSGHEGLLFYRFDDTGAISEERRYLDALTPAAQLGAFGARPVRPPPSLPAEPRVHAASPGAAANATVIRNSLAALQAGKAGAFLDGLGPDVVIDELMLPDTFTGRSGAEAWFRLWTRAFPGAESQVDKLVTTGDFVLVELTLRGQLEAAFGPLDPSPKPFAVHRAIIAQFREGRIIRLTHFMNGKELAEATAQWPLRAMQR